MGWVKEGVMEEKKLKVEYVCEARHLGSVLRIAALAEAKGFETEIFIVGEGKYDSGREAVDHPGVAGSGVVFAVGGEAEGVS
jgi:hypothetical protein